MILQYLKWPLIFLACLVLQTSFVPYMAVFGVKPDLLIVALFFFSIRYGVMPGIFVGFLVGLTQDLYSPAILGQNALAKTIIGACSGLFNEKVMRTDAMGKTVVLFVMFFVHDLIFMFVLIAKNSAGFSVALLELLTRTLPRAIYSGIIALLFYAWDFLPKPAGRR